MAGVQVDRTMSQDDYTRNRIEEAIAELDRPAYAKAIETNSFNPPGLLFETVIEESGAVRGELQAVALAMDADGLVEHLEGTTYLTVLDGFRRKHGYYRG